MKTWRDVSRHLEVVMFACGLSKKPASLVERVSELFVDNTLSDIRKVPTYSTGYSETGIVDILIPIAREVKDRAVLQPLPPLCVATWDPYEEQAVHISSRGSSHVY